MAGSDGHPVDLVVVGGGIAGLWILDAAVRAGRNAVLVEARQWVFRIRDALPESLNIPA